MNRITMAMVVLTMIVFSQVEIPGQTTEAKHSTAIAPDTGGAIRFVKREKTIDVMVGDVLFTSLDSSSYKKPILYPVYGPGQVGMTRNWPMKDDVKGEQHDHPHHKSLWIGHEIDGVDFWAEKSGSVKTTDVEIVESQGQLVANNHWTRDSDGHVLLHDKTIYQFGFDESSRWIDCEITFEALDEKVVFEDTKEGLFAIRTHPDLRLSAKPKAGVAEVFGHALNSEGVEGAAIWGKPAKWVLYFGEIDGKPMSIAMFDHPENLRHPTTWHAREYGLVTANPFGLHHFLGRPKGDGEFSLEPKASLKLRYRVEFIAGIATAESVNLRYDSFVSQKNDPAKAESKKD